MKQIEICGKRYNVACNALAQVKYKSFFKVGITEDLAIIQNYLLQNELINEQLEGTQITEEQRVNLISKAMRGYLDDFIIAITRIAWILIYTADKKVDDYEKWLESIEKFKIDDDWIVEVTELAVDSFCG